MPLERDSMTSALSSFRRALTMTERVMPTRSAILLATRIPSLPGSSSKMAPTASISSLAAEEALIRSICFGEKDGVTVGMWGDSNPVYMRPDYTKEYMDENFVQKLVGTSKADYDAWEGYGDILEAVDADAVTGATVSVSNVTSVIRSLFQYHADKYYS